MISTTTRLDTLDPLFSLCSGLLHAKGLFSPLPFSPGLNSLFLNWWPYGCPFQKCPSIEVSTFHAYAQVTVVAFTAPKWQHANRIGSFWTECCLFRLLLLIERMGHVHQATIYWGFSFKSFKWVPIEAGSLQESEGGREEQFGNLTSTPNIFPLMVH